MNKISIDVEMLEREKTNREAFFCSLSGILSSQEQTRERKNGGVKLRIQFNR